MANISDTLINSNVLTIIFNLFFVKLFRLMQPKNSQDSLDNIPVAVSVSVIGFDIKYLLLVKSYWLLRVLTDITVEMP